MIKPLHKTGLFVGRFQPLHKGHIDIIKKILKENEQIIIAVGSAEKNYVPENPMTAGERVLLIDETLKAEGIAPARYCIIPVRNIDNYALWVDHLNLYVPPYNAIYTGSPIVKACYEGAQSKHHLVKIKRILPISSTKIRLSMLNGTKEWKKMVPKKTAELSKKIGLPRRIKQIQETMTDTKYK